MLLAFSSQFLLAQLSVLTDSINSAIGVYADPWGNKWVTDQGTGHNDGRVLVITKSGKKHIAFDQLPSVINDEGDPVSAWKVIPMDYGKMALLIGGNQLLGPDFGKLMFFDMAGFVPGTSAPKSLADTTHSYDVSTFGRSVSDIDDSDPFSAIQDPEGNWYVVDAGANVIIRISRNGKNYSVLASFPRIPNPTPVGPPMIDQVPTGIAALPQYEGFLVTTLTGFPFLEGLASIYKVGFDGTVTPYLKGLTLLTDIAIDRNRTVYVNQFGKFSLAGGFQFGSGQVIRIRNHKVIDTIAHGYGPGPGMAIYDGRKVFVTSLFTGELLGGDIPAERSAQPTDFTSLEARDRMEDFSISTFPNPAQDVLQIKWKPIQQPIKMHLTDISGKVVWQQQNVDGVQGFKSVNVSRLIPGTYILTHASAQGTFNQKINILR